MRGAMTLKAGLSCLLILLCFRTTTAIVKVCDLEDDTCNAKEEFAEYTFSSWISDSLDSAKKYLGVFQDPRTLVSDSFDSIEDDAMVGTAAYENGWAYLKDPELSEAGVDDFIEQAKTLALQLTSTTMDKKTADRFADMMKEAFEPEDDTLPARGDDGFEYPSMKKLDAGNVGDIRTIELTDGRTTTIKTLALKPYLFEIDQFLTDEESDQLLETAKRAGTIKSGVFVDSNAVLNGSSCIEEIRNSNSTTLDVPRIDADFLRRIHERISKITNIPLFIIEGSEPLSIGHYQSGGFYHAHYDSNEASRKKIHCCFQSACKDSTGKEHEANDCCTICRYATFLYYLTDVEEGGETAFPFADMSMGEIVAANQATPDLAHLGKHCHDARVVVKPAKGKAIFWYNHLLDGEGYLGGVDKRSIHGGCNVTAGSKWIATNWISTPIYKHRYKKPRYRDISESYKQYVQSQL